MLQSCIILTYGVCRVSGTQFYTQQETDNQGILNKPHVFFLLGGPGSGKGTQAENLVRDYSFKHLSTGDLLREERQKQGELSQTIDQYIKEGKLLPSELVVKLLKNSIEAHGNRRYLIDGFPRNKENWDEFDKQLADMVVIRNLIFFDCPNDVMTQRIIERSKTSGRSDDNPETIMLRLQTFEQETLPVIKKFEERNNCIRIDATKSREEVY
jgi:UMP-CMP kinase family protein